jgi:hypothetical protein
MELSAICTRLLGGWREEDVAEDADNLDPNVDVISEDISCGRHLILEFLTKVIRAFRKPILLFLKVTHDLQRDSQCQK